jgi:hypothetical protein
VFSNKIAEGDDYDFLYADKVAFAFDILKTSTGHGRDCHDVAESSIIGRINPYLLEISCNEDPAVMKCVGVYEIISSPLCTVDIDTACNVPNEIDCIYPDNKKVKFID